MTNQLLIFAKGGDPVLKVINTDKLIRQILRFNLSGSNVRACFDLPGGLWPIKADREQIGQVLANITINAKQAMPAGGSLYIGGKNIEPDAESGAMDLSGTFVRITARDEGVGIPQKIIARIFDPYFSTKRSGYGLGLAVAHSIVAKHKGHLTVDSTPNVGTTFTLLLPAHPAVGAERAETPSETDNEFERISLRILFMDDEKMLRKLGLNMLRECGHGVDTAIDGREAIEKYTSAIKHSQPYDLVILDLTVPGGMGGKEAGFELLSKDPNARIIVSSGYSSDPVMANCLDYGFAGQLAKPYKRAELEREISRAMKMKSLDDSRS